MSLGTPEGYANTAAEEVLRLIYGDDFQGCTVSLDAVAAPILAALARCRSERDDFLDLHVKLVEAVHLLSKPPVQNPLPQPPELLSLLSQRLDAIQTLTQRIQAIGTAGEGAGEV